MGHEKGTLFIGTENDGRTGDDAGLPAHRPDLCGADVVGAGIGEWVLTVSGSTARRAFGKDEVSADAAIVGIIDKLEM